MISVIRLAIVVLSLICFGLLPAGAADVQMVVGKVTAVANAPEAAYVKVGNEVYKITKDANGRKVAAGANGQKVEIKGAVTEINGIPWMTVTSCKIVE